MKRRHDRPPSHMHLRSRLQTHRGDGARSADRQLSMLCLQYDTGDVEYRMDTDLSPYRRPRTNGGLKAILAGLPSLLK